MLSGLAAVMQHLQILEARGPARTERVGRVRICHVDRKGHTLAEKWFAARRSALERKPDRLGKSPAEED